jgi:multicomponent Na+:H+ antiporter subunit F
MKMSEFFLAIAFALLVTIVIGLGRILRGPTPADRMLTAQLFGTTGVAILLLLAEATAKPALRDVGLVFALLAVVATAVFVRNAASAFDDDWEETTWT